MNIFRKNFIWNVLGTTFNAFNSLFFLVIVTRVNGIENAGIFTLAFSTACLLYVIGIYSGRIFQVTENSEINDKEYIINRMLTSLLMVVIIIGFVFIKDYNLYKASIFVLLTIYKFTESLAEVFYGILQRNDELHKVGKSLFFKSLIGIVGFIFIDVLSRNLIISCLTIVVLNLIIMIIYDFLNVRKIVNLKEKIDTKNIFKILKKGFFAFSITFLGLYILNATKYSIDRYKSEDMQAIYGIIIMPATVMNLFGQFIIHPYLNQIMEIYNKKDEKKMNKILLRIIGIISGIGLICSVGIYILGVPVLNIVYGINLNNYSLHLFVILIAATLYTISIIYSSILTAIRHTFIQFIIYLIISVVAFIISTILVKIYGINGAVISYFIVMFVLFILYITVASKIIKKEFKGE